MPFDSSFIELCPEVQTDNRLSSGRDRVRCQPNASPCLNKLNWQPSWHLTAGCDSFKWRSYPKQHPRVVKLIWGLQKRSQMINGRCSLPDDPFSLDIRFLLTGIERHTPTGSHCLRVLPEITSKHGDIMTWKHFPHYWSLGWRSTGCRWVPP